MSNTAVEWADDSDEEMNEVANKQHAHESSSPSTHAVNNYSSQLWTRELVNVIEATTIAVEWKEEMKGIVSLAQPDGPTQTFHALIKQALLGAAPRGSLTKHALPIHRGALAFVRQLIAHVITSQLVVTNTVHRAFYHFLQYLLLRACDRADYRRTVALTCTRELLVPVNDASSVIFSNLRTSFVHFLGRMACNKRTAVRLMALEVIEAALQQSWSLEVMAAPVLGLTSPEKKKPSKDDVDETEEEEKSVRNSSRPSLQPGASIDLAHSVALETSFELEPTEAGLSLAANLFGILVRRCNDASPVVRAKSLTGLAHVLTYCTQKYGPSSDLQNRTRFCRVMHERMSNSDHSQLAPTAPNTPGAPFNRSASAPAPSATTPLSNSFSFLHTPLSIRSKSNAMPTTCATPSGLSLPFMKDCAFHPSLPGVRDILEVLYKRAGDDKAVVRRAAIQALECILVGAAEEDEVTSITIETPVNKDATVMTTPGAPVNVTMNQTIMHTTTMSSSSFSVLSSLTASDLQIFYDGCFDRSLSIRKQSLISLSQLLKKFRAKDSTNWPEESKNALQNLQKIWLGACLPLIQDQEKGVWEKCTEEVEEILIRPLEEVLQQMYSKKKSSSINIDTASTSSLWSFFSQLDGEMLHYFVAIFIALLKANKISTELIKNLLKDGEVQFSASSAPTNENELTRSRITWVLLECISHFPSTISATILKDLTKTISLAWSAVTQQGWQLEESTLLRLLSSIGHLSHASAWNVEQIVEFAGYLFQTLIGQVSTVPSSSDVVSAISPELIKKQIWILNSLCAALNKQQEQLATKDKTQVPAWEHELLTTCEKQLESYLALASSTTSAANSSVWNESGLNHVLFTLGEVILQHQTYSVKSTVSHNLLTLVQTFIAPSLVTKQTNLSFTLSPSLRAHAFLTLGKFCLRNELLAKKSINLFISELEAGPNGNPLIQNNILLILCDLCRTFTNIVDPYLSSITGMLSSKNMLLRKHTLMVLNVLLQEEYLKMKSNTHITSGNSTGSKNEDDLSQGQSTGASSMFYRYLRCLVDDDASIRSLVQVSLKGILSKSSGTSSGPQAMVGSLQSTRIHMHFVELIFFLNQCYEHPLYNQFGNATKSKGGKGSGSSQDEPFGLVGPLGSSNAAKRFTLYKYCLGLLTDEQKFILISKLHTEVLQSINEDSFQTSPWHQGLRLTDVIQDTLIILSSEFMQLSAHSKGGAGASSEEVEGELAELAMTTEEDGISAPVGGSSKSAASHVAALHAQNLAKARLLHKLLKKSTMDSCLPILFELRQTFGKVHSPLTQWLFLYFTELLQQYKHELHEVFAGDKMLEKELLFDLKRWNDEHGDNEKSSKQEQYQRWKQMDFTPIKTKRVSEGLTTPTCVSMSASRSVAPDTVTRRLSLGQSMPAGGATTPLKLSSLSGLQVASSSPSSLRTTGQAMVATIQSPILRRTLSTPSVAATASMAAAGLNSSAVHLRTPAGIMSTPSLHRRVSSTPAAAAVHEKVLRPSRRQSGGSSLPPSLTECVDEDEQNVTVPLLDEEEASDENRSNNIIIVPSPGKSKSRVSGVWNIALPGEPGHSEEPGLDESRSDEQDKKRVRRIEPSTLSALDQLTISNNSNSNKRKYSTTPIPSPSTTTEEGQPLVTTTVTRTISAPTAVTTAVNRNSKRKAMNMR